MAATFTLVAGAGVGIKAMAEPPREQAKIALVAVEEAQRNPKPVTRDTTRPAEQSEPSAPDAAPQEPTTALATDTATGTPTAEADSAVPATAAATNIPARALVAYLAAEEWAAQNYPNCHIQWQFVASFGEIESHHGRYGGGEIGPDGVATTAIVSYAGARGPLQFIDATWRAYQVDGDGDGVANVNDIDDAAVAAAKYLCVSGGDLSKESGQRTAAFAYNHADWYVINVMAIFLQYLNGQPGTARPAQPTDGAVPHGDPRVDGTQPTASASPQTPSSSPSVEAPTATETPETSAAPSDPGTSAPAEPTNDPAPSSPTPTPTPTTEPSAPAEPTTPETTTPAAPPEETPGT